jgi:hypothetical protein
MEAADELKVGMRKKKMFYYGRYISNSYLHFIQVKGNDCEGNNIPEERGM